MPGAITVTLTPRGRKAIGRFDKLGRDGHVALRDGLEKTAVKGATFGFRSFRDRRQYGQGGVAWLPNGGWWAIFKEQILGQRPPIPGQGVTGKLKRSVQFFIRSPKMVRLTPGGAETTFGSNEPYAEKFTTGSGRTDFWAASGGKTYRFSQGSSGRPFLPTNPTMRAEFKRQMELSYNRLIRKTMGV